MSRLSARTLRLGMGLSCLLLTLLAVTFANSTLASQQESCPIESVRLPLFDATPAATIAATPAHDEPAPEVNEASMQEAAEAIVACSNSALQADRYAVFTDRILAQIFIGENPADQPAFERRIATGIEPEPGAFTLEQVTDIEQQEDGRVAVTLHIATPDGPVADRVLLAWDAEKEAWLIDGVITLDPPGS